jgi:thioredoxin 2
VDSDQSEETARCPRPGASARIARKSLPSLIIAVTPRQGLHSEDWAIMATTTQPAGSTTKQFITIRCTNCKKWNRIDASRAANKPKCGVCGTPIELDHPVKLDDETFDRVINGTNIPVLVDFYADWCGPCKMMAPSVDELARTYVGKALITKLDTDASPQTAGRFQIRGIPTTIVFRNGKEHKRQTGAVPLAALKAMLDS